MAANADVIIGRGPVQYKNLGEQTESLSNFYGQKRSIMSLVLQLKIVGIRRHERIMNQFGKKIYAGSNRTFFHLCLGIGNLKPGNWKFSRVKLMQKHQVWPYWIGCRARSKQLPQNIYVCVWITKSVIKFFYNRSSISHAKLWFSTFLTGKKRGICMKKKRINSMGFIKQNSIIPQEQSNYILNNFHAWAEEFC